MYAKVHTRFPPKVQRPPSHTTDTVEWMRDTTSFEGVICFHAYGYRHSGC